MIVIPDIHGRDFWRKPVINNLGKEPIVFLGDYLDPYHEEPFTSSEAIKQLEVIIALRKENPENVVLLLGNHDIHYFSSKCRGSRYDYANSEIIRQILTENHNVFQLTYKARFGEKDVLFSHAGILAGWLDFNKEYLCGATQETIGDVLNGMWQDESSWPILFAILADIPISRWGRAPFGSPIWSDVEDMRVDEPELPGQYQVFGHTQLRGGPIINEHFACLDCRNAFRIDKKGRILPM